MLLQRACFCLLWAHAVRGLLWSGCGVVGRLSAARLVSNPTRPLTLSLTTSRRLRVLSRRASGNARAECLLLRRPLHGCALPVSPEAAMFVLVEMTDTVRIPPWQFERKLNESIAEELNKKLANKVTYRVV